MITIMINITSFQQLYDFIKNNNNSILIYDNSNLIEFNNDKYIIKFNIDYPLDDLFILMEKLDIKTNIKYLYDKYKSIGFNDTIIHKILKYINLNLHKETINYDDIKEYIEDKKIYGSYITWSVKYQALNETICNYYDFNYNTIIHNLVNNINIEYVDKAFFFDKNDDMFYEILINRFHLCYYHEQINGIYYIFKYIHNKDKYIKKYNEYINILYLGRSSKDLLYDIVVNNFYSDKDIIKIVDYYKYTKLLSINELIKNYNDLDNKFYDFIFKHILDIKEYFINDKFINMINSNRSYNLMYYILNYIFKNDLIYIMDDYDHININILDNAILYYLIDNHEINNTIINNIFKIDNKLSYELCIEIIKNILLFRNHIYDELYNKLNNNILMKLDESYNILDEDYRIIINYYNRFNRDKINSEIYDEYIKEINLIDKITEYKLSEDIIKIIHEYYK